MPEWTKEQREAIFSEKQGIIVSAAAGSGKTAVLAERIARFASEGKNIENLVAVTFTHLASAEIKQRVKDVLKEKYKENPAPELRRNMIMVQNAKICTIDSFMGDLVRQNFASLGLSPDFSYIDATEKFTVRRANIEKLLEEYYGTYPDGFEELLEIFGGDSDNNKIISAIDDIYDFATAIPFWEKWLGTMLGKYDDARFFTDIACEIYEKELKEALPVYNVFLERCELTEKGFSSMSSERGYLIKVLSAFSDKNWDEAVSLINSYKFPTRPGKKDDPEVRRFAAYRDVVKKRFGSEIFKINTKDAENDLKKLKRGVGCLCDFIKRYHSENMKTYKKLNRFPFDAISHFAVSLTVSEYDPETRDYVPTRLAKDISSSVIEIMIDEYQDTNDLQDLFFTAVSDGAKKMFAVGDVKQSIYGFRRAEPKNFIRKAKELYRIDLAKNFRSKKTILDFANFICSSLLDGDFYKTDYSEKERLVSGRECELADDDVEIYVCPEKKKDESVIAEARFAARRIKELVKSGYKIFDKSQNGMRPVNFSDIAVLLRIMKDKAAVYESVFREENIPVTVGKKASLFDSVEVNVITAYLSVVNNPYSDLPLVAVMLSRLYGFTEDDVAEIRMLAEKKSLYEGLLKYAETNAKAGGFLRDIKYFRLLSSNIPVDMLVWKMLTATDYLTKVSCGEFGYSARENLLRFYEFSKKYSESFSGGLFAFIDFIDRAREKAPDEEGFLSEGNFVRIMTCHKSKGLEFPVCIVACLDSKFGFQELKKSLIINDETGISTKIRDDEGIYETTTLHRETAKYISRKNSIEEFIRLMYVSLTRARDKLILITSAENEEKFEKYKNMFSEKSNGISFLFSYGFDKFDDLIFAPLAFNGKVKSPFFIPSEAYSLPSESVVSLNFAESSDEGTEKITKKQEELSLDIPKIKEQIAFGYDGGLSSVPAKLTVTELVKNKFREENDGELLIAETVSVRVPEFISGKKDGAFYGTASHKFLNFADLNGDFESEKKRLVAEGRLTEDEASVLRKKSIETFKESLVFKCILNADRVLKEENFVVPVPASFYDRNASSGEILLQGAMDVLCEYPDGFVLVDYKTDNKTEAELIDKYAYQLYLYSVAAEKMFSKKVKKAFIWSFKLEKGIDVTPFFPENG